MWQNLSKCHHILFNKTKEKGDRDANNNCITFVTHIKDRLLMKYKTGDYELLL